MTARRHPISLMLLALVAVAAAQKPMGWNTLNGDPPMIIAKGGFSGLFPDSSSLAYDQAVTTSSRRYTILYCDVRLTKDGIAICLPHLDMSNGTNIADVFPQQKKTYLVNGVPFCGWPSVDYYWSQIQPLYLKHKITRRMSRFDGMLPVLTVEDLLNNYSSTSGTWLNVQHDSFYTQFGLSMRGFIISASSRVDYISSPEVGFLTSIIGSVPKTKLIFRFLDMWNLEPSLNFSFGSLIQNLTFVKTFASGIIVPKYYIWPVLSYDNYLQECTSVVTDAHNAGLKIYVDGFSNDLTLSYNYSFDPVSEYLSYIDNDGIFSVDGVLTEFPVTASEALGCFTNLNKSNDDHGKPLIISHNGASGDYPGCSDLAYQKAVDDGADVIDCPVQLTKDGIPICLDSSNLLDVCYVPGVVAHSTSTSRTAVPSVPGFFTYNFTWHDIANNLQPKIATPFSTFNFFRNPRFATAGNFTRLSDFLDFAKDKDLFGVMITIEPALTTPEEVTLDMLDAIIKSLRNAGYDSNTTSQRVMIYSYSSSILMKFKQETKYELVYDVNGAYEQISPSGLAELEKFANAVAIPTSSVIRQDSFDFTVKQTEILQSLQAAGYPVYVYNLENEFVSQPPDFFFDATAQMNAYVQGVGVDGVITDFPATARRYKANTCRNMGNNKPGFMAPVRPGGLLKYVNKGTARTEPVTDLPLLTDDVIAEPPLPQSAGSASPAKRTCWVLIALSPVLLFNY